MIDLNLFKTNNLNLGPNYGFKELFINYLILIQLYDDINLI